MKSKKERLIEELEKEMLRLQSSVSVQGHKHAIEYLKTGKSIIPAYRYDMLDAARDDFDMLCADYGVN